MTILVDTIGSCGRIFVDRLKDAGPAPHEALAPKGAILVGAVLPDVLPGMTGISRLALEMAVRFAVLPGLVGAAGVGQALKPVFDLFQCRDAATIMLAIFALVLAMEWITDPVRKALR